LAPVGRAAERRALLEERANAIVAVCGGVVTAPVLRCKGEVKSRESEQAFSAREVGQMLGFRRGLRPTTSRASGSRYGGRQKIFGASNCQCHPGGAGEGACRWPCAAPLAAPVRGAVL
jgi:hypothetical protein